MQGFKSFAEKTILEFGDGITAVVGPNGSGKSNISDAIRWVLGEQSPKSLRGGKMEDVIFAGTENRKPVSFAEVSIVMDNRDGTLNIDFDEVKVTRRLFRSGESEYLINGKQARLKDINLLFADTGIGKEGYSIIGQGKVDEILSNKSEDRRGIFEEASGIMKFRIRKQESERKLAQAEQNLIRIDDIIGELETQITLLKKQAAVAEQYLKLKTELREIEVGVLVDGIRTAETKLKEIRKNYDAVSIQIANNEYQSNCVKAENEQQNKLAEELDAKLSEARENAFAADKAATEYNANIVLNNEKIKASKAEIERIATENDDKLKQREIQKKELKNLKDAKLQILKDVSEVSGLLEKEQQKLDIVVKAISGGSLEASEKNKMLIDLRLLVGKYNSSNEALKQQIEIYKERVSDIDFKLGNGRDELDNATKKFDTLKVSFDEKGEELDGLEKNLAAADKTKNDLEEEAEEKKLRQSDLKTAIDTASAQLKLLKEMEENFEGYAKSVKEILTLCRENKDFGKGIHGAVAQIITCSKEDELAIETALGNTFQDIITDDESAAKQAIEYLKTNRLGRATFLPITAVTPKYMESDAVKKLKNVRGYIGIASNLVKYESKYENVIASLLGKVAVFEDIDSAIFAAKQFGYSFMCVTREGDILRTSGAITGGSPEKGKRGGALSRTRDIPELVELIEKGEAKHAKITGEIDKIYAEISKENAEISSLTAKIRDCEVELATIGTELKSAESVLNAIKERDKGLLEESEAQEKKISEAERTIIENNAAIEKAEKEIDELNNSLAELMESAKNLDNDKERYQNSITGFKLRQAEIFAKRDRVNDDIARIEGEISDVESYSMSVDEKTREANDNIAALENENKTLEKNFAEKKQAKDSFDELCRKYTEEKKENDENIKESFRKITEISETNGRLREEAGRLDARRMRYEHDLDYNKTRLWEEYELTYSDAFAITKGEVPSNLDECKKRISDLRASIKKLGSVNVASIEELKETSERYDFLTAQRKDIDESKQKLVKVISELETVMKKQFKEQFAVIRENFQKVFTELFGGGKADIVLADESNVLDCGIEINVQPPGKKLQNMMLLSGGERALTAIALLFGILRMNPTPFCMLDEIESALDDANVYRFARYTRSLSQKTQLILVTHRKGTMESADSLYGVTMEEKGVSKVLSVKV